MNRTFSRFSLVSKLAATLALSVCALIFCGNPALAQSHSSGDSHGDSSHNSVNKMSDSGAMSDSTQSIKTNDLPNGISGNVPDAAPQQNSYGVNSPGRLIGPSPENGQPDPRFPNERGTSSGSGNEGNNKSTAAGSAPAPASTSTKNEAGSGEAANSEAANGTTTSNINEGLPSASEDNSGGNSGGASGGTGGGAGGTEVNAGGDARPDKDASTAGGGEGDMGRQTRGAAPYALGLGAIVIGTFLAVMMGARAKRNR